jgi:hypothetical protein
VSRDAITIIPSHEGQNRGGIIEVLRQEGQLKKVDSLGSRTGHRPTVCTSSTALHLQREMPLTTAGDRRSAKHTKGVVPARGPWRSKREFVWNEQFENSSARTDPRERKTERCRNRRKIVGDSLTLRCHSIRRS